MHRVAIPQEILDRVRNTRGGRQRLFETLEMGKVAHVVVDLQNGYLAEGAPIEVPHARGMIGRVNALSAAVRAAGGTNVFLRFTYDPDEARPWTNLHTRYLSEESLARTRATFSRGADLWQLYPALDVAEGDLVLDKTRFSAFIPGTCDLDAALQARGIETLIISGALTNCCCESTARDAMQLGYCVIFVSDANAARTDTDQNGTLASLAASFGDVMSTQEVLDLIAASPAA